MKRRKILTLKLLIRAIQMVFWNISEGESHYFDLHNMAWFLHREAFVWKLHNNTSHLPSAICLFTEVFWGGRQDNTFCYQGEGERGMKAEARERERGNGLNNREADRLCKSWGQSERSRQRLRGSVLVNTKRSGTGQTTRCLASLTSRSVWKCVSV